MGSRIPCRLDASTINSQRTFGNQAMMETDSSAVATMDGSSGSDGPAGATNTQGRCLPRLPPPARESLWAEGLNWPTIAWFVAIHLGALAALFTFSWPGLAAMAILSWFTAGLGFAWATTNFSPIEVSRPSGPCTGRSPWWAPWRARVR